MTEKADGGPVVSFLKDVFTNNNVSRFWDLGEEEIICPSQKSLSKIMNALILCHGKLHDTHSLEARDGEWKHPTRSCAVVFRISLPIGTEEHFQELSGFTLSDPPEIHLN